MSPDAPKRFHDMLREIDARLQKETRPEVARELKEIRTKLKIMGPVFVDEAGFQRLHAMFDKTAY